MAGQVQRGFEQGQAFEQMLRRVVVALRLGPGVQQALHQVLGRAQSEGGPGALP